MLPQIRPPGVGSFNMGSRTKIQCRDIKFPRKCSSLEMNMRLNWPFWWCPKNVSSRGSSILDQVDPEDQACAGSTLQADSISVFSFSLISSSVNRTWGEWLTSCRNVTRMPVGLSQCEKCAFIYDFCRLGHWFCDMSNQICCTSTD